MSAPAPDSLAPGSVDRACRATRGVPMLAVLLVLLCALQPACTATIRTTDPARTATEQFMLSTAAQRAVEQLSVEGLRGRTVFVDSQYFAASESAFVLGELRARLLMNGAQLLPKREDAQIVLEVRSGGVGIDRSDFLLGVPSLVFGAGDSDGIAARTPLATPEIALIKNQHQLGLASVAFIAYWKDTGEVVMASGPAIGRTTREDWWIFGLGRRTIGDIAPTDAPE